MLTALRRFFRTWRCRLFGHRWHHILVTTPGSVTTYNRCRRCGYTPPLPRTTAWPAVPREDLTADLAGAGEAQNPQAWGLVGTEQGYLLPGTRREER